MHKTDTDGKACPVSVPLLGEEQAREEEVRHIYDKGEPKHACGFKAWQKKRHEFEHFEGK